MFVDRKLLNSVFEALVFLIKLFDLGLLLNEFIVSRLQCFLLGLQLRLQSLNLIGRLLLLLIGCGLFLLYAFDQLFFLSKSIVSLFKRFLKF